jgi:hypothetical protein
VFSACTRCYYSEAVLKGIIGSNIDVCVFRMPGIAVPASTGSKPYIILPDVDFSLDELKVVLLHEWKHYHSKDALTRVVVEIICMVYWWNPLVNVLRRNVEFTLELKCDYYAMANFNDHLSFKSAVNRLRKSLAARSRSNHNSDVSKSEGEALGSGHTPEFSRLITYADELKDRYSMQAMRNYRSIFKRRLVNVVFSVAIIALLFASYAFLILPAFWVDINVPIAASYIDEEYQDYGGIFMPGEVFIVDNGDGTFSLYVNGEFVQYVNMTEAFDRFIPVRQRDDCGTIR